MSATHAGARTNPAHSGEAAPGESLATLLRSVFESVFLLLLLLAIEALFFGHGRFASLSIHPFWIVVLLASVQNGLFAGIITTAVAALLMDWPPRPIGADITAHYLSIAILPLQWLLVSLCIGLFRQAQMRTEQRLLSENARLNDVNEALAAEIMRLDGTLRDFEVETATAPCRPNDIGEALRKLAALREAIPDDIQHRFDEAAAAWTPEPARLLLPDGQGYADHSGAGALNGLGAAVAGDDPVVVRLEKAGHALLVKRGQGDEPQQLLAMRALAVAPDNSPAAIVAIAVTHEAEASAAVLTAEILAQAAGPALSRSLSASVEMRDA